LPAIEALASGVPSILTGISNYINFDEKRDFTYFVPTHRPDRIAEGVLAFIKKFQNTPQLCWGDEGFPLSPGGRGLG